ncbi:Metal tolerance protein 8 [Porphyridium purpureum]|uniref:Metal tolerance protein 8 n=1 Tax=Porphyridium purpureum TaxID=35688 RepID=A0A5J4YWT5_PORPP|nr:Metal tolerance protein 8 [Porphyridium purpureum]|eukprot:POR2412..scf209_3
MARRLYGLYGSSSVLGLCYVCVVVGAAHVVSESYAGPNAVAALLLVPLLVLQGVWAHLDSRSVYEHTSNADEKHGLGAQHIKPALVGLAVFACVALGQVFVAGTLVSCLGVLGPLRTHSLCSLRFGATSIAARISAFPWARTKLARDYAQPSSSSGGSGSGSRSGRFRLNVMQSRRHVLLAYLLLALALGIMLFEASGVAPADYEIAERVRSEGHTLKQVAQREIKRDLGILRQANGRYILRHTLPEHRITELEAHLDELQLRDGDDRGIHGVDPNGADENDNAVGQNANAIAGLVDQQQYHGGQRRLLADGDLDADDDSVSLALEAQDRGRRHRLEEKGIRLDAGVQGAEGESVQRPGVRDRQADDIGDIPQEDDEAVDEVILEESQSSGEFRRDYMYLFLRGVAAACVFQLALDWLFGNRTLIADHISVPPGSRTGVHASTRTVDGSVHISLSKSRSRKVVLAATLAATAYFAAVAWQKGEFSQIYFLTESAPRSALFWISLLLASVAVFLLPWRQFGSERCRRSLFSNTPTSRYLLMLSAWGIIFIRLLTTWETADSVLILLLAETAALSGLFLLEAVDHHGLRNDSQPWLPLSERGKGSSGSHGHQTKTSSKHSAFGDHFHGAHDTFSGSQPEEDLLFDIFVETIEVARGMLAFYERMRRDRESWQLLNFLIVQFLMVTIEYMYGTLTDSVGLISASAHTVFCCLALMIGLLAIELSHRAQQTSQRTGAYRYESLSGFINGILLVYVAFLVLFESIDRFLEPPTIESARVVIISALNALLNGLGLLFFPNESRRENHNLEGAYLHIWSNTLPSVGLLLSTLLSEFLGWSHAEPAVAFIVSLLIGGSSLPLLRRSVQLLILRVPCDREEAVGRVQGLIAGIHECVHITQFHAWEATPEVLSLSMRLSIGACCRSEVIRREVLACVESELLCSDVCVEVAVRPASGHEGSVPVVHAVSSAPKRPSTSSV